MRGSFIFGLPSDTPDTFAATADLAERAELTFAQFVPLTPFPGTIDFEKWEKAVKQDAEPIAGMLGRVDQTLRAFGDVCDHPRNLSWFRYEHGVLYKLRFL
jgi:hypothetical protein